MQHISPTAITTSLPARLSYLQSFLSFRPTHDGPLIHACAPVLIPLIPTLVDAVYDHLLKYDITAAAFLPAPSTATAHTSPSSNIPSVHTLTRDSAPITFRKDFLKGYLRRLAANTDWTPESPFWAYLDGVGKAHTGAAGVGVEQNGLKHHRNKPPLWVDYRDVNLLLGWVEGAVMDVVMGVDPGTLDLETKVQVLQALNKYWWIQNDLFARHYVDERGSRSAAAAAVEGAATEGTAVERAAVSEKVEASGSGGVWSMLGWGK